MKATVHLAAAACAATMLGSAPVWAQTRAAEAASTSEARIAALLDAVSPTATQPDTAVRDLTLDEALEMALEKNLDIAVERLNPSTFDLSLEAIRRQFNPAFTSTLGANSTTQLPTSQLIGGDRIVNEQLTWNFGLQQLLPKYGTQYSVAFNNRRQDNNNSFATFNPQYNVTLTAQVIQPLLRGLRTDNTRTQLRITRINRELSDVQLRARVINTLASVRTAYWELVFANDVLDVARRSLQLAEKLVEDNKVRVEVGTLAPIDVIQAEAEAATRRQTLAQLEAQARTAEITLKQLLVDGTSDVMWSTRLRPTDRPAVTIAPASLEDALRNALSARTDLIERRRNLEITQANLDLLKDQSKPSANLVANYGGQGIGGDRITSRDPFTIDPGGYGDALNLLRRRDYPTWTAQVQVNVPLFGNPQQAQYDRARIGLEQSEIQIRNLELQIAADVTNARLQVDATLQRVEAARAARELAQRRLEAEQSKFEVGLSTNFFVVQAQRDLQDAENSLLRAQLDHQQSLINFERVQLTAGGNVSFANAAGASNAGAGGGAGNAGTGAGGGTGLTTGTNTGAGAGTQLGAISGTTTIP